VPLLRTAKAQEHRRQPGRALHRRAESGQAATATPPRWSGRGCACSRTRRPSSRSAPPPSKAKRSCATTAPRACSARPRSGTASDDCLGHCVQGKKDAQVPSAPCGRGRFARHRRKHDRTVGREPRGRLHPSGVAARNGRLVGLGMRIDVVRTPSAMSCPPWYHPR
jgi:hypothetical protein